MIILWGRRWGRPLRPKGQHNPDKDLADDDGGPALRHIPSADLSAAASKPLGLGLPCVALFTDLGEPDPQRLDLGVQLAAVDGQFDALVLRLGKLKPQLGAFQSDATVSFRERALDEA